MTSFHPFPRLPPELRRQIWDLTVVPRQVKIRAVFEELESDYEMHWGEYEYWRSREPIRFHSSTKTPPALQACRESRACLVGREGGGGYTQALTGGSDPIYTWVSFAVDTIWVEFNPVPVLEEEYERIIRLELYCASGIDTNFFGHHDLISSVARSNVKELTLSETGPLLVSYQDEWLMEAYEYMWNCYDRCDPVSYYTRIRCPQHLGDVEMNTGNFNEIFKAAGERYLAAGSENPRAWRPNSWRHSETCTCEDRGASTPSSTSTDDEGDILTEEEDTPPPNQLQ
ncbi:hypothetical protein PG991_010316 [Apiospora marii]|uniref:2EXR domain-containing protein n=1 Tax=Apiospora marii TaxID=335849 RepID=A0ABR1RI50_9PEZI